ncbi:MAG: DUF805 domain-containing protein [Pseudomonadota bacterium]
MGFFKSIGTNYSKMVIWKDRASRSEFWWFQLYLALVFPILILGVSIIAGVGIGIYAASNPELAAQFSKPDSIQSLGDIPNLIWVCMAFGFLVGLIGAGLPGLSSTVRRLHDSGHSGWWYWITLIPVVGIIILIVLLILPSDENHNRFGPPPGGLKPIRPYGYDGAPKPRRIKSQAASSAREATAPDPRDDFKEYYRNVVKPTIEKPKPST